MPERDATLDAFITPDPEESEETPERDGAETPERDRDESTADDEPQSPTAEGESRPESTEPGTEPPAPGTEPAEPITEPAATTFAWTPDGEPCPACGETARRRWRTDAGFVCGGCVDWERTPEG